MDGNMLPAYCFYCVPAHGNPADQADGKATDSLAMDGYLPGYTQGHLPAADWIAGKCCIALGVSTTATGRGLCVQLIARCFA